MVTSGHWACQARPDGWLWWLVLLKVTLGQHHLPAGGLQRREGLSRGGSPTGGLGIPPGSQAVSGEQNSQDLALPL